MEVSPAERKVVEELIASLRNTREADKVQFEIFEIAKRNNMPPGDYFKLLYRILLGSEKGPRLGPYIVDTGVERTISSLERALKQN